MSIKARFIFLAAAFALVAMVVSLLAIEAMSRNRAFINAYSQASEDTLRGEKLNRFLVTMAVELRDIYLSKTRADTLRHADKVDHTVDQLQAHISDWYTHVKRGDLPELDSVADGIKMAAPGIHNLTRLARDVSPEAAATLGYQEKNRAFREKLQTQIDVMIARLEARLAQSRNELDRFQSERVMKVIIVMTGAIGLLLAAAWGVAYSLAKQLRDIRRSIEHISEGAFDEVAPAPAPGDEIGDIWGALDELKGRTQEGERLTRESLEKEKALRELILD